jgi:predicted nucleic acid-binding protein
VILVDTSVWIDHLRRSDPSLERLLQEDAVLGHRWVTGELALGNLVARDEILDLLKELPQAVVADDDEVLRLIEHEQLFGSGIGYIDAQLLAATRLSADTALWTRDRSLAAVAVRLGMAYQPTGAAR